MKGMFTLDPPPLPPWKDQVAGGKRANLQLPKNLETLE